MRALAILLLLICHAWAEPAPRWNPIQDYRDWANPPKAAPEPHPPAAAEPQPAPKPTVEAPKPPPVTKSAPARPARPKPHADKPKAEPARRQAEPARQSRPAMCGQIATGVSILGVDGMVAEAKRRGYSESQIRGAARACGY